MEISLSKIARDVYCAKVLIGDDNLLGGSLSKENRKGKRAHREIRASIIHERSSFTRSRPLTARVLLM